MIALLLAPVIFWHAYRGAEEEALTRLIARFNQGQQEWQVEPLALPFEALATKLTSAIPGGHGPDLFVFAHERLGTWAREGYVAQSDYAGPFREALTVDGRVYGYPLALKSVALFYNRALVHEPPVTLDDLVAKAKEVTRGGVWGLAYPVSDPYFHAGFLTGFGG